MTDGHWNAEEDMDTGYLREELDAKLYQHGRDRMARGELEEAVQLFRASAELHPHYKTLELLGECLMKLKRYKEALVPLAAATGLNFHSRAPTLLAELHLILGDPWDAKRWAEEALRRNRTYKPACEVLAKAEAELARRRETWR